MLLWMEGVGDGRWMGGSEVEEREVSASASKQVKCKSKSKSKCKCRQVQASATGDCKQRTPRETLAEDDHR
jgi:hypothetical protein